MIAGMSSRTFRFSLALILMPVAAGWASRAAPMTAAGKPAEVEVAPFLRAPAFDVRKLTSKPGQPSVAVAVDGTVLVFWGKRGLPYLFRSEDGGETWSDEITVTEDPNHAGSTGAAVVDELTGDVLIFCYRIGGVWMNGHSWRSRNHGKTWIDNGATDDIVKPNTAVLIDGIPSKPGRGMLSGNDSGITLRHGEHRGRLLISARNWSRPGQPVSSEERHSLAIYSDDGGRSWQTSGPFPAYGTGEAALEELSDGRIYYNSRRHWAPEGVNPRRRRWIAWSYDGGATWKDLAACAALPDGHTSGTGDPGLMGAVTRLPVRGRDILLFSNMDSPEGRRNGTVWVSFDGAKTWPLKRSVEAGGFQYSSLAMGRPGTASEGYVYLLYQGGGPKVARFNLSWVLEGTLTGDGTVPEWVRATADGLRPPR
jgi:sialidase-1